MYKKLILKFIALDFIEGLFLIGLGIWMVWVGTKNLSKATNPKVGFTVAILFILAGLSSFYFKRMNCYDYYQYLIKGDNYVKSNICEVDDIAYSTISRLVFGSEDIKCANDKWYRIRLQHTYCFNIQRGQTLKITYLPNSKIILKIQ